MKTVLSDALKRCSTDSDIFDQLINEQTPGGLNEKVINLLEEKSVYKEIESVINSLGA